MNLKVIIKPSAQLDIDEAFLWYEKTLDNLGFEFLLSLDATIQAISRNPQLASYILENVRGVNITRFPFSMYYVVESEKIIVLAVFHHSRNPEEWMKRI